MVKGYTLDETLKLMRKRQGDRTMSQYALDLGVTQGYLSDVYREKRSPGAVILEDLGLAPVMAYVKHEYDPKHLRELAGGISKHMVEKYKHSSLKKKTVATRTPELKATTRFLQTSAF